MPRGPEAAPVVVASAVATAVARTERRAAVGVAARGATARVAAGAIGGAGLEVGPVVAALALGDDERLSFEFAVSLVDEWTRTPEDFERMQSAYYVHFGEDPLCVGFWKS